MINKNETKLLLELSKLIDKFGGKTFINLANNLKDPAFISSIEAFAEFTPKLNRSNRKRSAKTDYNKKSKEIIESIRKSDFEKYEVLKEISSLIDSKMFLGTLKEITIFLENHGVYQKQVRARPQGKFIIVSHLVKWNISEIKQLLSKIETKQHSDDRSLDAWSQVILNKSDKG